MLPEPRPTDQWLRTTLVAPARPIRVRLLRSDGPESGSELHLAEARTPRSASDDGARELLRCIQQQLQEIVTGLPGDGPAPRPKPRAAMTPAHVQRAHRHFQGKAQQPS